MPDKHQNQQFLKLTAFRDVRAARTLPTCHLTSEGTFLGAGEERCRLLRPQPEPGALAGRSGEVAAGGRSVVLAGVTPENTFYVPKHRAPAKNPLSPPSASAGQGLSDKTIYWEQLMSIYSVNCSSCQVLLSFCFAFGAKRLYQSMPLEIMSKAWLKTASCLQPWRQSRCGT